MKLLPAFLRRAARPVTAAVGRVLQAASSDPDNPRERNQWRLLGRASARNLPAYQHKLMVEQCTRSAQVDGMSRAHVRLVRSITVGAQEVGIEVRCKEESARLRLQALVDLVWEDPENDFGASLGDLMDDLTTSGSLIAAARTDEGADGRGSMVTRFGYVDPEFVTDVLSDPGNARAPIAVIRSGWLTSGPAQVAHPVLRGDDSVHAMFRGPDGRVLAPGTRMKVPLRDVFGGPLDVELDAPVVFHGVNRASSSQTLGISDLYPSLDLMGLLDELVFGATERAINFGSFSIHVKFPAGTPKDEIEDRMKAIQADLESGRGRAVGTTDDVSISAIAAQLQAGEWATIERTARTNALIGLGPWPIHIFSDGGATNVATAVEQGSPVANFLLDRQNGFRRHVLRCVGYAVRRFPEGRRLLAENPDAELHLGLPVIVAKDTTRESNVWTTETNTLVLAVDRGFLSLAAAQREWRDMTNRYGLHVTPEDAPDPEEFESSRAITPFALPEIEEEPEERVTEGTPVGEPAGAAA